MRNDTGRTKPPRSGRNTRRPRGGREKTSSREAASKSVSPQHTAEQRAQMQTGLRILARIIARAHLRQQSTGAAPEPPPDQEAGD